MPRYLAGFVCLLLAFAFAFALVTGAGVPAYAQSITQSALIPCPRAIGSMLARPASGAGLFVAGQQMTGEPEGLPQLRRGALLGIETVPRSILKAMICSRSRRFGFATLNDLATNIAIRGEVIRAMHGVMSGQLPISFMQEIKDLQMPPSAWRLVDTNRYGAVQINGHPVTWQSQKGTQAHQAIESLFTVGQSLEPVEDSGAV